MTTRNTFRIAIFLLAALPALGDSISISYTSREAAGTNSGDPGCCLWVSPDGNIGQGTLAAYPGKTVNGTMTFDSSLFAPGSSSAMEADYTYSSASTVGYNETWVNGSDPWTFDFSGYHTATMAIHTNQPGQYSLDYAEITTLGRQALGGYYYYSYTDMILYFNHNTLNLTNTTLSGGTFNYGIIYHYFMTTPSLSSSYANYQVNSFSSLSLVDTAPEPGTTALALIGFGGAILVCRRTGTAGTGAA